MRRYSVRVLVAVLTFGLGVAFSFALGLFRVPHTRLSHKWSESSSCRKNLRVSRPAFLTVDNQANDPLRIAYLGAKSHSEMAGKTGARILIENKSNKTITSYAIGSEKSWREDGKSGVAFLDFSGNVLLEPGESESISVPRGFDSAVLLRVEAVDFQDGSRWINPRTKQ